MNEKNKKLLTALFLLSLGVYCITFDDRVTSAISLICGWLSGALYISATKTKKGAPPLPLA